MMKYLNKILATAALSFSMGLAMNDAAHAVIIHADSVASIANSGSGGGGTHFHTSPSAGLAVAHDLNGHALGDETRVISLFDLSLEGPAASATLGFDVDGFTFGNALQRYDIFGFTDVTGAIEASDFQASPTTLQFAAFDPTGNPIASIDITSLFNAHVGSVLGLRIQPNFQGLGGVSDDHFSVQNFRIETANAVSEPGTLAILGLGLFGLGLAGRRHSRRVVHSAAS